MKYKKTIRGNFVFRPNRFIAKVLLGDKEHTVHVKNTGRCKELLTPGACVILSESDNESRRTKYDIIAVEKPLKNGEVMLINMDSQAPNAAAFEWLTTCGFLSPQAVVKREVTYGNSRFDIYFEDGERRGFVEVKGVTLEADGVALFPDAPTERGVKHINELCMAVNRGYEAYILFVIQMKGVKSFSPNDAMHPEFGAALRKAESQGVRIFAYDSVVTDDYEKVR